MKHHLLAIGLALFFWLVVACADLVVNRKPAPQRCNPRVLATCEP